MIPSTKSAVLFPPPSQYGILLAEPQPIIAYALSKLFAPIPRLSLLATIENGQHVLSYFRKLLPDIIILASDLPGIETLELVRQLKKRDPNIKLLIYTPQKNPQYFHQFLRYGVQGLVLKTQPTKNLLDAIQHLIHRKIYIDPALNVLPVPTRTAKGSLFGMPSLSPRERQILKLVAEGLKNKEISSIFSISVKTVESHRSNIMRKLDAHHLIDLLNWARRYDLTPG